MTDQTKSDVARLRDLVPRLGKWVDDTEFLHRAADALERLATVEAERDRLRDAVKVLRECLRKFEIGGFESARLANAKADAILAGKEGAGE